MKTRRHFMKSIAATGLGGLGALALPAPAGDKFELTVNYSLPYAQRVIGLCVERDRLIAVWRQQFKDLFVILHAPINPVPTQEDLEIGFDKVHGESVRYAKDKLQKDFDNMMLAFEAHSKALTEFQLVNM